MHRASSRLLIALLLIVLLGSVAYAITDASSTLRQPGTRDTVLSEYPVVDQRPSTDRLLTLLPGASGTQAGFTQSRSEGAIVDYSQFLVSLRLAPLGTHHALGAMPWGAPPAAAVPSGVPLWAAILLVAIVLALLVALVLALLRLFQLRRLSRRLEGAPPPGPSRTPETVPATGTETEGTDGIAPADSLPPVSRPPEELLRISLRIVQHLAAQGALRTDEVATRAFTQAGMEASLGASRSSVSNALRRLERAGILQADVRHVHGEPRRLRVYTLTDRGWSLSSELPRLPR